MFVSVCRRGQKYPVGLYECLSLLVNDDPKDAQMSILTLELKDETRELRVNKREIDVFVMNEDGATVNSYRWSSERVA